MVCIGDHGTAITSSVAICNKKVITSEIGHYVFSAILTLLAISYTYNLAYNPMTQQVLEFLQEKVVGDCLPASRKISTAFSNLSRAISCIEQKMAEELAKSNESVGGAVAGCDAGSQGDSDDETQRYSDFQ